MILMMTLLTVGIVLSVLFFIGILADIDWMVYLFGGILIAGMVAMLIFSLVMGWIIALEVG